jgi:DNA gyrase/topoisomerase IV subunit A
MKAKPISLSVSKHIDVNFRNYALYVLENRGIPAFDDALTNVQRFILMNAPHHFNKTISLVGACISGGYHHGDMALTGAINKLARPYGNSISLLEGDGFFGTPVDNTASAARYTSIKINSKISEIIKKSHFLNKKNESDSWDPLWVDLPIGLTTMIVGIAVGYKTTILPRKLEDIQKYLDGKVKEVKPHFQGFTGKITRYQGLDKSWLITGSVEINEQAKTIKVTDLPPLMKYTNFLKKINQFTEDLPNCTITNNSSEKVEIIFKHKGAIPEWEDLKIKVDKATKLLITETLVFVKGGVVINYNRVEDYIDDYKYRIASLNVERLQYYLKVDTEELEFQKCKNAYLKYMISSKSMRQQTEIDEFIDTLTSNDTIRRRLNSILLKTMSEDEYNKTIKTITELEKSIIQQKEELRNAESAFQNMVDGSIVRSTQNQKNLFNSLLSSDEPTEIDGIEYYAIDDAQDE